MNEKISQEVIELYDEYTHAPLERRDFLSRLGKLVGGSAAAVALLPFLQNNYAQAAIIDPDDDTIETSMEQYNFFKNQVHYYQAKPKGDGPFPTVVVCHENRGLNPHIKDIVRRLAKEGFLAYAPDALSFQGGTPEDEDKAKQMIKNSDRVDTMDIYRSSVNKMVKKPFSNGSVGCIGFCWGGGWANKLAVHCDLLKSSVSYYGMQLGLKETQKVKVPLLLHYAGLDKRINAKIEEFTKNLMEHQKEFTLHYYANVNHAFNNDTNSARYNKEAAELSWSRTVEFLRKTL